MSSRNPSYTNPKPCKHLEDYKLRHGLSGYKSIQKHLKATPHGRTSVEMLNAGVPRCNSCNGFQAGGLCGRSILITDSLIYFSTANQEEHGLAKSFASICWRSSENLKSMCSYLA
ncbi:ubiquitin carboxyl-terminal hydrolase 22 [Quercus suber]|uniref:Ubiquitin carboxyl-terminal hydrolase 22 n=1 Tax=Quercus suber TaxID=58331 RepID=A0AAW0JJQ4_QUESU